MPGSETQRQRWRIFDAAVFLVAAAVAVVLPPSGYRIDLDVYRTGAQVWLRGRDLYGELPLLGAGIHLPFTYPPISAILFSPLAALPLWWASAVFTVASVAVLFLVAHVATRSLGMRARWAPSATAAGMMLSEPVRATIAFGQVNILLMGMVVVGALALRRRPVLGGVLIGLATAIKLTPLVFAAFLVLKLDWRRLGGMVLGITGATGIGFALAPTQSWRYWTEVLSDPGRIGGLAFVSNQSINGALHRLVQDPDLTRAVWFLTSVVVGLALLWLAWHAIRGGRDLEALVTIAWVSLLCSPVSWTHHWVWAGLALLVVLVRTRSVASWMGCSLGALVLVFSPLWWLPHGDDAETRWAVWQHVVGNAYLLFALAWITASVIASVSRGTRGKGDLGGAGALG